MRAYGTGTIERTGSGKYRPRLPGVHGKPLPSCGTAEEAEQALNVALERVAKGLSPFDAVEPAKGQFASFIYFIREEGSGFVKIGRSNNPDARRYHLQSHTPHKVEVLCVAPGGPRLERALHLAFAPLRRRGEWFDPDASMMALIDEMKALWNPGAKLPPVHDETAHNSLVV